MIETEIDKTTEMTINTPLFGEINLPLDFTGTFFQEKKETDDSDLWWIEGDLDLARMPQDDEIKRLGEHFIIRSKPRDTVYIRCIGCMEETVATTQKHEKALHGFFIENECPVRHDEDLTEKLKTITGEE